jgi:hypothetical protein
MALRLLVCMCVLLQIIGESDHSIKQINFLNGSSLVDEAATSTWKWRTCTSPHWLLPFLGREEPRIYICRQVPCCISSFYPGTNKKKKTPLFGKKNEFDDVRLFFTGRSQRKTRLWVFLRDQGLTWYVYVYLWWSLLSAIVDLFFCQS